VTNLLDGNVLVAVVLTDHVHHDAATEWRLQHRSERFATCPITQGTLLRLLMLDGASTAQAVQVLNSISKIPNHEFWLDDVEYISVQMHGIVGHRQITDAYLAQLARHHRGKLITFDQGLAALHGDVAVLVPTSRS
jgi:uncharacterized protein